MSRRRLHHLRALIVASAAASACATAEKPRVPVDARPDLEAVVVARLASIELEGEHRVRFNPVACDCPELEVLIGDVWHRLALVDGEPAVYASLRAALADDGDDGGEEYRLVGRLSDTPARCGRAAVYLTLEPELWLGQVTAR